MFLSGRLLSSSKDASTLQQYAVGADEKNAE